MAKCLQLKIGNRLSLNLSFAAIRIAYRRLSRTFSTGNVAESAQTGCRFDFCSRLLLKSNTVEGTLPYQLFLP